MWARYLLEDPLEVLVSLLLVLGANQNKIKYDKINMLILLVFII